MHPGCRLQCASALALFGEGRERATAHRLGSANTASKAAEHRRTPKAKSNQAGREDRPVLLETDFVSNYAVCLLRRTPTNSGRGFL